MERQLWDGMCVPCGQRPAVSLMVPRCEACEAKHSAKRSARARHTSLWLDVQVEYGGQLAATDAAMTADAERRGKLWRLIVPAITALMLAVAGCDAGDEPTRAQRAWCDFAADCGAVRERSANRPTYTPDQCLDLVAELEATGDARMSDACLDALEAGHVTCEAFDSGAGLPEPCVWIREGRGPTPEIP
jgi:hypothetical protein